MKARFFVVHLVLSLSASRGNECLPWNMKNMPEKELFLVGSNAGLEREQCNDFQARKLAADIVGKSFRVPVESRNRAR